MPSLARWRRLPFAGAANPPSRRLIPALPSELELEKYKYVVQVVIGEQRGEGVKMGCRCFWDANTDNFATAEYSNSSIFCVACAFGVYLY